MNEERIMVCVYYGPSGERLIHRGIALSRMFLSPLYVLYVSSQPSEDMNQKQRQYVSLWQHLSDHAGAEFIYRVNDGQKPEKVIAETAKNYGISQVIIGQSLQTRWEVITEGCFATKLVNHLGNIDLHIIGIPENELVTT